MRRLQKKARKRTRKKTREPLAEGIVPLRKNRQRNWRSLSDAQLVEHTRQFMEEKGISRRRELQKVAGGLYHALWKRKLLDMVGFEEKVRYWASMSDDELVTLAKRVMKKGGMRSRTELQKADCGLYRILRIRKLLDMVGFEEKVRYWASMSDDELVSYAKRSMKKEGISGRKELQQADGGLYNALHKRKMLDRVGFEEKKRPYGFFKKMSDEELVAHARKMIKDKKIKTRTDLHKASSILYCVLQKRKLLGSMEFEEKKRPFWNMSDEELIAFVLEIMEKRKIRSRGELQKTDPSAYTTLSKRKLLDRIGFEEKRRQWNKMDDDELVAFAKKFMKKEGISRRNKLEKADSGLYSALRKRKLLDRVGFEDIRRSWDSFSDAQLIKHARQFMEEREISGRSELKKTDSGLYQVLRERKLLNSVFADVEKAKEKEEIQQIVAGLEEFSAS